MINIADILNYINIVAVKDYSKIIDLENLVCI